MLAQCPTATDGGGGFKSRLAGAVGHTVLGCEEAHWPETPQEAGGEDSKIRSDDAVGQICV